MGKTESIECPLCHFRRLIDKGIEAEFEVIPPNELEAGKKADLYQKCHQCKQQIGLRFKGRKIS